ncbi:MAG: YbhB/YbcL family Raf kinase inhibitor-like protein [Gammaproteobacteria bacterium]|nr:YbhB/YbcL family Raf kinase inhibitor-like protein [Gammaproteobacteria bacterium]MDE2274498.1 YbhB/YbcL family Raf kinase inhibitor-like protein [Gammaproteobacteria bacterium]
MTRGWQCLLAGALLAGAALPVISEGAPMTQKFQLSSSAYADNGAIPTRYTCDGADLSPPLVWSGAPAGTKSFAFIMDDPDAPDPAAPKMTWVHWVLYDIPVDLHGVPEGGSLHLPAGTREGTNGWKRTGYGGPCPPIGRHRYFQKLYALDTVLPDLHRPSKDALLAAMRGHVLAETQIIGTYQHPR